MISLTGESLLGAQSIKGTGAGFQAINPATGEALQPEYRSLDALAAAQACELAAGAFKAYRHTSAEARARFLEAVADNILGLGSALVERAMAETGLPQGRIEGERGRTIGQLKLFAEVLRGKEWQDIQYDPALPDRQPPRLELRSRNIPLGPVVVFGASNFPLAFSVAGGDTASALAAGAPVIVKAHPAHPGTSELVGKAIQAAAKESQMPEGTFSLLFDAGHQLGASLVAHPAIKAVGFTGSRTGGTALMAIAAQRAEPIPVYAEMSSINPVFLLPGALAANADTIAEGFVGSLTLGAGQFCTNPGIIIAQEGADLTRFVEHAAQQLSQANSQTMLTPGIHQAYQKGVEKISAVKGIIPLAKTREATGPNQCQGILLATTAEEFLASDTAQAEIFGAAGLVIACSSSEQILEVAEHLEGQLTATVHATDADTAFASTLVQALELKAGRILFNGFPTGVEVCSAMVHGGPYPATSDSRSTSVGTRAIFRFLRPVCYQNFPQECLPESLRG